MPEVMICTKCGGARFNSWNRCMDCRNGRAKVCAERIKSNGGSHTSAKWQSLLRVSRDSDGIPAIFGLSYCSIELSKTKDNQT